MPPTDSFLTNLLEMRSHYQAQIQQCDRLVAHAQEQLSHVNALLVDEALNNQQFATNLLQMRSHYQTTVEEQRRRSASALEQLVHINALLAEQIVMQRREEQTIFMQATAVNNNSVLTEGIDGKELPLDQLESEPNDAQQQVEVVAETEHQEPSLELQLNSPLTPQGDRVDEVTDERLEPLPLVEVEAPPASNVSTSQTQTPLLVQYQHLTKSAAVEKLLQENIATILHVNYILRALYGDLDTQALKVERQRLYETLSKGVARGLWNKVADQPGCYTSDLKLVDRQVKFTNSTDKQQAIANDSSQIIELLPAYQHLNFTQAVETVLQENAGQIMNSDKVARTLYGDLEAKKLSKAKDKVGKILWAGARQKRWQPVAGKLGAYTMSLENV